MKLKKVLLLYKQSVYTIYSRGKHNPFLRKKGLALKKQLKRLRKAHHDHKETFKAVKQTLHAHDILHEARARGEGIDYSRYDVVITVGGDGTFLEGARRLKKQLIIGVNSAPEFSVGRYCISTAQNFEQLLKALERGHFSIIRWHRLRLKIDGFRQSVNALNDVLVCHQNPAVMCRYCLKVKGRVEEQRSSGVWVSTASGSSGAIKSAGARVLAHTAKKFQYLPRELYPGKRTKYHLKGSVLNSGENLSLTSLMPHGVIYVDGAHQKFPFEYGTNLKIAISPNSIKTVQWKK